MSKVLFSNSGSEANDTAVKLVWYYNNAIGRPEKRKIIARERGYHGVTIAAGSLTGLASNHAGFNLPIPGILHTDCPSYYHYAKSGETEAAFVQRLAQNLEAMILREGPETVAAFIAEPVNGSGGVIVPPANYFAEVQKVLRKYDILFIVDEVICGFGRTGKMFGSETFGIVPDIVTVAKALSASYMPISAVMVNERLHQGMIDASRKHGVFAHGVTYSGHPVCAAVALETLKIYEERDIVGHIQSVAPAFQDGLRQLGQHPLVGEARGVGLIGALEIVADKATGAKFDAGIGIAPFLENKALDHGLIIRTLRDGSIAICPPLIITQEQVQELLKKLGAVLDDAADMLAKQGWKPHAA
jgi:4-aminobutyrate--pyruvate transaminase